jgi:hypothetical protein
MLKNEKSEANTRCEAPVHGMSVGLDQNDISKALSHGNNLDMQNLYWQAVPNPRSGVGMKLDHQLE